MYNEEAVLTGGLGIWLAFGLFAVTTAIGIGVFFWYLRGQREGRRISQKKTGEARTENAVEKTRPDSRPDSRPVAPSGTSAKLKAGVSEAVVSEGAVLEREVKPDKPVSVSGALTKTRASLFGRIQSIFGTKQTLSDTEREELEEILYTADLGPKTVQDLLDHVFDTLKSSGETGFEAVRRELSKKIAEILEKSSASPDFKSESSGARAAEIGGAWDLDGLNRLKLFSQKPSVLLVVGVNGAGKTTTIGKLAAKLAGRGCRVLVAAGDTFRAAAGEQLKTWTDRAAGAQSEVVGGAETAGIGEASAPLVEIFDPPGVTEPSAVAYQALEKGRAQGFDIVIIDTAGRLHTQKNLMEELKKMRRVLAKLDPLAPHETLLVLDANSGQNALIQAKEFHGALTVDGVVLTKLDGSAKGGVAVGISHEVGLPIKLIGVGEKIGDLRPFQPKEFVESILG
jgi:fused signal recognition particle receptor